MESSQIVDFDIYEKIRVEKLSFKKTLFLR